MNNRLVQGVGVYEKGDYVSYALGKETKHYRLWVGMLERCYSDKHLLKRPTYLGCSVSSEFSNFQKFAKWCDEQVSFGINGYQLDKDIIYKGNKQYNRESCAFVPREVNMLLINRKASRGEWPIGVYFDTQKGKFMAQYKTGGGKRKYIGLYSTPDEAFIAYKEAKENHIKMVAEKYKDSIDPRVYRALLEWSVEVED